MVREHSPQTQPDKTQSDQIQSEKVQTYAPLQSGDRLSRPEFERRYAAAPHIKKAELIEGIVYVASPPAISNSHYEKSTGIRWDFQLQPFNHEGEQMIPTLE